MFVRLHCSVVNFPGFDKKSGGRIVNITSGQFQGPMAGELAYATTKELLMLLLVRCQQR